MSIDKNRVLHALFFTPTARGWGLPGLWWGEPGIGKTAKHKQFARSVGAPLEVLAPGERGEGAFGVVPVPATLDSGAMVLRYPAPEWLGKLVTLGASPTPFGLVLVDEYTTAPPAIQPALLSLVLEGTVGGAKLGERVRIFAAANPTECSAGGYDIAPPAANRHIHLPWEISANEVAEYYTGGLLAESSAVSYPIDAVAEETRVMSVWPSAMASAAGKVASFIKRFPDAMHRMPKEGDPNRSRAWPSPRSWELAIRCLAAGQVHVLTPEEIDVLGAGCVGENAWQEFSDYLAALNLPDPAQVLDGAIAWSPDTKRLDVTSVVINGCVALVVPSNAAKRQERSAALWALLDTVGKAGARDLTHIPATTLAKAGLMQGGVNVLADMRRSGFQEAVK